MATVACPKCGMSNQFQALTSQQDSRNGQYHGFRCTTCQGIGIKHLAEEASLFIPIHDADHAKLVTSEAEPYSFFGRRSIHVLRAEWLVQLGIVK